MNTVGDYCHPYTRTNFKCTPATQTTTENCLQKSIPCGDCCLCYENQLGIRECVRLCNHQREQTTSFTQHDPVKDTTLNHCVPHECPRETGVSLQDHSQNGLTEEKDITEASGDFYSPKIGCRCHQDIVRKEYIEPVERPCCAKITSWTEPRICRCDPYDTNTSYKRCECECGSAVKKDEKKDISKNVRFADEVTYVDCDKAFQNLQPEDVKELCRCCKGCANQGKYVCIGKPVMVYELPEPRLDDTSVTRKDYHWHKTPQVEVPPWHPNIKDRWHHLDVPSITETTYQCDFKPPPAAVFAERNPVYLAPQRKQTDPCQELAEVYSTWKKTSDGPKHIYHSSCDSCDKDLQQVHLHECETAHLPPQYQCHGDGHICDRVVPQRDPQFALCEREDNGKSRYWWQRICCLPEKADITKLEDIPADFKKPACPSYTTIYMNDFKSPKRVERERLCAENCTACEYCSRIPNEERGIPLCTRDPNQPFITQRGGVIGT